MAFFFDDGDLLSDSDDLDATLLSLTHFIAFEHQRHQSGNNQIPTHTEDGIPIRKLYISNLPNEVQRKELFELFASYGHVKSCWVKTFTENIKPYAFITFEQPEDAQRALKASQRKLMLRGKFLRVLPADSWHQPQTGADGKVIWSTRRPYVVDQAPSQFTENHMSQLQASTSTEQEKLSEVEYECNILDVLNADCIAHILSYIPLPDLMRSEAVSKRWRNVVHDYMLSIRTFNTLSWKQGPLTTAKLRHLLQRMGPMLKSLDLDGSHNKFNARTAHTIGKFCPNLEKLSINAISTKYWNPIVYSCKNLHTLSFTLCDEIDDSSLTSLLTLESSIEHLHISENSLIGGKFLEVIAPKLQSLSLQQCSKLQGDILKKSFEKLSNLKYLYLKNVRISKFISEFVKLTNLEELYLINVLNYSTNDMCKCDDITAAVEHMPELRAFAWSKNKCIHDKLLKQLATSCKKLRKLDIMGVDGCDTQLESAAGIAAVAAQCSELEYVNISHNSRLPAAMKALASCKELRSLIARGSPVLTDDEVLACIVNCRNLEILDLYGCEKITESVVAACQAEIEKRPRRMTLYLGCTTVKYCDEEMLPKHPLLTVYTENERLVLPLVIGTLVNDTSDDSSYDYDHDFYSDDDYDEANLMYDPGYDFDDEDDDSDHLFIF